MTTVAEAVRAACAKVCEARITLSDGTIETRDPVELATWRCVEAIRDLDISAMEEPSCCKGARREGLNIAIAAAMTVADSYRTYHSEAATSMRDFVRTLEALRDSLK